MYTLKIIATVFDVMIILLFAFMTNGYSWQKDKSTLIGFGFIGGLYLFNLALLWI